MRRSVAAFGLFSFAFIAVLGSVFDSSEARAQDPLFVRGDVNQDGFHDVSDPVTILLHLFAAGSIPCEKAADFDDNGELQLTDGVAGLDLLFRGGAAPGAPFPLCGVDPTADDLGCESTLCSEFDGSIVINEFVASNGEGLVDEDGDTPDWIEFHMPLSAPAPSIDLTGWRLVNNPEGDGWQFPDGLVMRRGEFLLVFASGKDRGGPGEEIHTSNRLDSDGEYIGLMAPDLTIIDEVAPAYPRQRLDISYGRVHPRTVLVDSGDELDYHVPEAGDSDLGTSWTEPEFVPDGWQSGASGHGFTDFEANGFEVTLVRSNIPVEDLETAERVLRVPALQDGVSSEFSQTINYLTDGDAGNFRGDEPFPGLDFSEATDFVVEVRGTIAIPEAGFWSFGVNSSDGFRLDLTIVATTFTMSHETTRAADDTIEAFDFPVAGTCVVSLLYFQRDGGAGLELFGAKGALERFNGFSHRLVGDGVLQHAEFDVGLRTDVAADMLGVNSSLWLRREFDVDDVSSFGAGRLNVFYGDGFIAYLNGYEVARANAPSQLTTSAESTRERELFDFAVPGIFNLSDKLRFLRDGRNVLAIHALNDAVDDPNFFIRAELEVFDRQATYQYMTQPTPRATNVEGFDGIAEPVEFSVERGFHDDRFDLELSTLTDDASIRFTTNGSTPSATNGTVYTRAINVSRTSTIRAVAVKDGFLDSDVTTHSYLFISDVITQGTPVGWPQFNVNGQYLDYGMDPDITQNARWSGDMHDALTQIPSISLVTDLANLVDARSGIYVNARQSGRAWERRTSVELLQPDGSPGFALEAGLRIRGAFSRRSQNPKHSFRLFFRRQYGAAKLDFPLFGGEGADSFDKVDLRTSQNYSWAQSCNHQNTFIRDVWTRDAARDQGFQYTRSRYYHLYVNGHYWGLFQTEERADADHGATYSGGDPEDYDVIKTDSSGSRALQAADGTMAAYRRLYDAAVAGFRTDEAYFRVQGLTPAGEPDPEGEKLLNKKNLIDFMANVYYTGDPDSPVSRFSPIGIANNVFAMYNREKPGGWMFFRHDAEHALGAAFGRLFENSLLTNSIYRNSGSAWQWFNASWLHLRLGQHPEYYFEFADRVVDLFYNGGALSAEVNAARWMARADQIDLAVIAASARWGDAVCANTPRTKDNWEDQTDWMLGTYFPQRTQIVINDMRSVDMFPEQAIVSFSEHGGEVEQGFGADLDQAGGAPGTIYYTTDGSDPRLWGGDLSPTAIEYDGESVVIDETLTLNARVRDGEDWGAMTSARFTVGIEGLVLNEIVASNSQGLEDPAEPGENPDWIEVYNGTANTVDMSGMYLSDDSTELAKWRIGNGVSVEAGQFILFLADDDGTQGPTHTSFQLSRSGETLFLVDSDGKTIIDSVVFDQQETDVSYGRFPDGTGDWDFLQAPTPFDPNREPR